MYYFIFIISVTLVLILSQADTKYTICVVPSYNGNDRTKTNCPLLSQNPNSQVECIFANDKTHCVRKILDGNADFGVFRAEEISYASLWNDLLSVTNEIRSIENDNYEYNMVVLVNDAANINSIDDLYDKRLCHPGFSETDDGLGWSDSISQYFEKIVVTQKCDPKLSIAENQLRSLSEHFDLSCKPGQWDPNPDVDNDLKTKYPSLCANCKNPLLCNSNDQFWGRQGALTCLNEGYGDVAWARLSDVKLQFKEDDSNACGKINYLCPDGSSQPLNSTNPCAWISRPWPAIVSRKSVSKSVQEMINYALTAEEMKNVSSWQWSFKNLLIHYSEPMVSHQIKSPKEYLSAAPGYLNSQNKNHNCGKREFSMCVENTEAYNKCQTLSDISVAFGIEPKMNCIQAIDCGQLLENGDVDVVIIDADTLASYKRHYKTKKPVLFATSLYHRMYRKVSAVMLKKKYVKNFEQLKGRIGCFPSFDGFAWNSFLMTAKLHKLELYPNNNTVKNFFSNSCAIISSDYNSIPKCEFDDILPEDSKKNGLLSEILALRCIIDGGGDVAFINTFHLSQYLDILRIPLKLKDNFTAMNFSTVCSSDHTHTPTDCPLSWSNFGQIIMKPNVSSLVENEIITVLLKMDATFGQKNKITSALSPSFLIYGPFDNSADPLFPIDTEKLETASQINNHKIPIIPEYESNLHILNNKNLKSSSNCNIALNSLLLMSSFLISFMY